MHVKKLGKLIDIHFSKNLKFIHASQQLTKVLHDETYLMA
jgi:hypothetical protein